MLLIEAENKVEGQMELPPGFRFHPTDEELITHYLSQKITDTSFTATAIGELDLNKFEPWDLPLKARTGEEWYFFSLKDRKYPTGLRTNRATEAGYWQATGKDKEIHRRTVLIGMKKTLVFYTGRAPRGQKTNWIMHEYRLEGVYSSRKKNEWVLCRVFHRDSGGKDLELVKMNSWLDDGYSSSDMVSLASDKNHVTCFSNALEGHRCHEKMMASSFNESLLHSSKTPLPISFHYTNQAVSTTMVNLHHQGTTLLQQLEDKCNGMKGLSLERDVFSIAEEKDLSIDMKNILLDVTNNHVTRDLVDCQDGLSDSCAPLYNGWSWK